MRLFEAIIDANHRAIAGDKEAGLRPAEFKDSLPIAALSCIDVRLNPILPEVLGIPEEEFIWLRNAGNIITSPLSSTMRSLALACAVKGAKEIVIIGHTDCQICKTTTMQLLEKLKNIGVERSVLPDNINEYFGMFSSERQNVIKACDIVRHSPIIGSKIPVHGLLVDIADGKLEWLVNGYQASTTLGDRWNEAVKSADETIDALKSMANFQIGEMKFPETKIGETVTKAADWLAEKVESLEVKPAAGQSTAETVGKKIVELAGTPWKQSGEAQKSPPPRIPQPPPMRPRMSIRRGGK